MDVALFKCQTYQYTEKRDLVPRSEGNDTPSPPQWGLENVDRERLNATTNPGGQKDVPSGAVIGGTRFIRTSPFYCYRLT
mmetsp:Transcript_14398/g.24468  ORF Transcript_14398/g.24468 Transcript_14398/m.24468 type:complete len:80 (-) Transcript_14398:227-466(-)